MPICSLCSFAVTKFRPHDPRYVLAEPFCTILPRFDAVTVNKCWICTTFSQWLRSERPDVLETWQEDQLEVAYYASGRVVANAEMISRHPLCFLMMDIAVQGHENCSCGFLLSLIPAEGSTPLVLSW